MPFLQNSNLSEVGDVELMFPGDRFPVLCGPDLLAAGWRGGQFVRYVTGNYDFTVEVSDGNEAAGFLLFQSEKYEPLQPGSFGVSPDEAVGSPENWLSHQYRAGVGGQNVATMISGGTRALFKLFETTALTGAGTRTGGPITYSLNESLKVSENGLLCNDSNGNLAAAGVTTPLVVGIVSAVPSSRNGGRLGIDMKF
jgi:hypothetical protein